MRRSDSQEIAPLELDIFLPEQRIAIEYCGLYWHSELAGKTQFYHAFKRKKCDEAGIRLITIFEDEWLNNRGLCEAMLANALKKNTRRINAREGEIRKLDSDTANKFLNQNHIQGRGRSNERYGLFIDDELVSVMTFMKSEISRRRTGWEINRFCSKAGTTVRGGASRLFKAFLRDHGPEEVVSYADLRWGTGGVYEAGGFRHVGNSVPNYWYFRPNEMRRYHRYALRKNADDPPGMTEWQARQEQGWNRIWDCGHAKWVWSRP